MTVLAATNRPRWHGTAEGWRMRGVRVLPAAAALLCIAVYAGQLGLGRWQSDEFTLLINQRDWGWHVLSRRLVYAPRPFSEGLLFLYGEAVLRLGRPLIAPFLAVPWTGVLGAAVVATRSVLPPSRLRLPTAFGLASVLFAFVLVTNSVTEVFYWPMAAAAYLPTTGSAVVLMFLLSRPLDQWRRLGCGAALLVAAASTEMGAALAIGFAGAAAIEAATRPGAPSRLAATLRESVWWIVPGVLGLITLAMIASLRAGIVELGSDTQPYTGQAAASIGMALRQLALDLVGGDGAEGTPLAILGVLATKLLFGLGFALVWRQADRAGAATGRWHTVLAVSLGVAVFFSAAASYYHYGTLCCERQSTTRFWLCDLLAIMAMAWMLAQWPARGSGVRRAAWLPPILLTLALFPILFRIDALRHDYDNLHLASEARTRTWRSGLQTGTDRMEFRLPPDKVEMLVRGTSVPIGIFRSGPGAPLLLTELGRFFGKGEVLTCQSWQTEKSWLIHGQFIPACPPHDGPPDSIIP